MSRVHTSYTHTTYIHETLTDYTTWTETRNARFEAANYASKHVHTKLPTTYAPTKTIDNDQLEASVAEQIACFGHAEYANQIGSSSTSYKYAKKQQALGRSLNAAFRPRDKYASETLSIDATLFDDPDTAWLSDNSNPIDQLIELEDSDVRTNRIATYLNGLTDRQREALTLVGQGLSYSKVGEQLGISKVAVHKLVVKARARATELTSY